MIQRALFVIVFAAGLLQAQITMERLLRADQEPANWFNYSGGYFSQRYSKLTQITPDNVKNLELSWVFQLRSAEPTTTKFEATPIVVDGVMYTVQPPNDVFALDAATGKVFWSFNYRNSDQARACCGRVNRGLAILGDTLFMGTLDDHVIALAEGHRLHADVGQAELEGERDGEDGRAVGLEGEFGVDGFWACVRVVGELDRHLAVVLLAGVQMERVRRGVERPAGRGTEADAAADRGLVRVGEAEPAGVGLEARLDERAVDRDRRAEQRELGVDVD